MNIEAANNWLEYADMDLDSAKILVKHSKFTHVVAFHCQQAVEKVLKAYLTGILYDFPKTHDTYMLCQICSEHERIFDGVSENCLYVKPYYIESRYPIDIPVEITTEEVEIAIKLTQDVYDLVAGLINGN